MSAPHDRPDDRPGDDRHEDPLLDQVRAALDRTDPPPAGLRDAAVRALTWDTERVGLAALSFDSLAQPAGMRGGDDEVRDLVFTIGEVVIEVTVTPHEDGSAGVSGSVTGVATDRVVVRLPERRDVVTPVDQHGRFDAVVSGRLAAVQVPGVELDVRTGVFPLAA